MAVATPSRSGVPWYIGQSEAEGVGAADVAGAVPGVVAAGAGEDESVQAASRQSTATGTASRERMAASVPPGGKLLVVEH
jgi:uncharacterized protein YgfB (UPF0149 family)